MSVRLLVAEDTEHARRMLVDILSMCRPGPGRSAWPCASRRCPASRPWPVKISAVAMDLV
jgi:hypothetical protein